MFEKSSIVVVWGSVYCWCLKTLYSFKNCFLKLLVCSCNYYKNRQICHSVVYLSSENCLFFDALCFALLCFSPPCTVVLCVSPLHHQCCLLLKKPGRATRSLLNTAHTAEHRLAHDEERRSAPRCEPASVSRRPAGGRRGALEEAGWERLLASVKVWGEGDDRRVIVSMTLVAKYWGQK